MGKGLLAAKLGWEKSLGYIARQRDSGGGNRGANGPPKSEKASEEKPEKPLWRQAKPKTDKQKKARETGKGADEAKGKGGRRDHLGEIKTQFIGSSVYDHIEGDHWFFTTHSSVMPQPPPAPFVW